MNKLALIAVTSYLAASISVQRVDFRYALPWWQTSICLPDDADKPLAGKEGQLFYDYGQEKGPRRFAFSIAPDVEGGARWVSQRTASARVPVIETRKIADGVEILEETFIAIPSEAERRAVPFLERVGGEVRMAGFDGPKRKRHELNFAEPSSPSDPAFRDVARSEAEEPIEYRLHVARGSLAHIVAGFCEGKHDQPGQRVMTVDVEGGASQSVDAVRNFGKNRPGAYALAGRDANNDGVVEIRIRVAPGAADRVAAINALWAFTEAPPPLDSIIRGERNDEAYAFANCGVERLAPRRAIALMTLKNASAKPVIRNPVIHIQGVEPVRFDRERGSATVGHVTRVLASGGIESSSSEGEKTVLRLRPVSLAPGEEKRTAITVLRHTRPLMEPLTVLEAAALRDEAKAWWQTADLPYGVIQVPDPGVQAMLDSCVRNIWQSRDIREGNPAFHVGPTVYRMLWIVDGAFLLETAAMLGRAKDARAAIDYVLSFQEPHGGFELKKKFWKEDGLVLWTVVRHALLTQDREWLRERWPRLKRVVVHIQALRREASRNPDALEYGLLPPGDIDGGIYELDKPEFSNTYWCLSGLKAAIDAARWLGDQESAAAWQTEYDSFYAQFRKAAARDLRDDGKGHRYLPTLMANRDNHLPQRGQWAFCHGVYPGQLFAPGDPLVAGNLGMLEAARDQGLVIDTGWMKGGLWTYFASFYGHAMLWEGRRRGVAQVLYDFANHAVPTRVWREEQKPLGKGVEEVGDMPHNWASAEFIRLAAHMIALERGDELHLFEGVPAGWLQPGMITSLNGLRTRFGEVRLQLRVLSDGKSARLTMQPLTAARRVVVHLGQPVSFEPGKPIVATLPLTL